MYFLGVNHDIFVWKVKFFVPLPFVQSYDHTTRSTIEKNKNRWGGGLQTFVLCIVEISCVLLANQLTHDMVLLALLVLVALLTNDVMDNKC